MGTRSCSVRTRGSHGGAGAARRRGHQGGLACGCRQPGASAEISVMGVSFPHVEQTFVSVVHRSGAAGPEREKALEQALAQIEKQFGKGSVMRLGDEGRARSSDPHRLDRPRHRARASAGCRAAGSWRSTARNPRVRPPSRCMRSPMPRPPAASPRSSTPSTRSTRTMPRLGVDTDALLVSPARHRRAGAGDRRHAGALGRLDLIVIDSVAALVPRSRDRGRDGRQPRRTAGPADEPGAAQDDRCAEGQLQHHRDLHQPVAREDRRDVRLAGDHHRWPGAEVLLVGAP
jgi:hypothetical protein